MNESNMSDEKYLGMFYLFGGVVELKDYSYKSYRINKGVRYIIL
jgi:hypothetical protein